MNLQQFNQTFTSALDLAAGIAIPSAIAYCGGLLYGYSWLMDKYVVARAFAISVVCYYLFQTLVMLTTGGKNRNPKAFYATQMLGTAAFGVSQIIAYRNLQLIGQLGTILLAACVFTGSLNYLLKLGKLYIIET